GLLSAPATPCSAPRPLRAVVAAGPVGLAPDLPEPTPALAAATGGNAGRTLPSARTPPSRHRFRAWFPGSPVDVAALSPRHSSGSHKLVPQDVAHAWYSLPDEEPPEDRRDLPQSAGPCSAARAQPTACSFKLLPLLPWFCPQRRLSLHCRFA